MPPGTPRLGLSSAKRGLPFKAGVLGVVRAGETVAYRAGFVSALAIRACRLGRRTRAQVAVPIPEAIPFLGRNSLAANNVTAVRLGRGGNLQSGTISTAAPSRRLVLWLRSTSRGVRSRAFARLATTLAAFAPSLGTVGRLRQRRNRGCLGYQLGNLIGCGLLGRLGCVRAGFHEFKHCPTLCRDLPAPADAFD